MVFRFQILQLDSNKCRPVFYVGQALLLSEKQRADNFERTYAEVCKLSEKRRKKLEETERRVYQLQASLNK